MTEPLLGVRNLAKYFGGVRATDDLSLDVREGEIHALIGPNGAGKTTLIAQLIGETRPDAGVIRFDGADITSLPTPARVKRGLARTFQITELLREETALANVALDIMWEEANKGWWDKHVLGEFDDMLHNKENPITEVPVPTAV